MFEIIISLLLLVLGFGSGSVENIRERLSTPFVSSEQVPKNDIVEEFDKQVGAIVEVDGNDDQSDDQNRSQDKNGLDNIDSGDKKGQEKVAAYNEASGKVIKSVAKIAIEKSPALTPFIEPDPAIAPLPSPTPTTTPTPIEVPKPVMPSITPIPTPIIVIPIPGLPKDPCPPIMVPPPGYKLGLARRMPCMY